MTLFDFLSSKNDVNVASKSNKQKKLCKKISFLLASWRSMTKIAGSGSGSISQRHGPRIRIRIHPKMSWIRNTGQMYWSGSGSFYHQAKIVGKALIPAVLRLLLNFLSLKSDVNVPYLQKVISRKTFFFISFLLPSWRPMTKTAGPGSISQRHGSADPDHTKLSWIQNTDLTTTEGFYNM